MFWAICHLNPYYSKSWRTLIDLPIFIFRNALLVLAVQMLIKNQLCVNPEHSGEILVKISCCNIWSTYFHSTVVLKLIGDIEPDQFHM